MIRNNPADIAVNSLEFTTVIGTRHSGEGLYFNPIRIGINIVNSSSIAIYHTLPPFFMKSFNSFDTTWLGQIRGDEYQRPHTERILIFQTQFGSSYACDFLKLSYSARVQKGN